MVLITAAEEEQRDRRRVIVACGDPSPDMAQPADMDPSTTTASPASPATSTSPAPAPSPSSHQGSAPSRSSLDPHEESKNDLKRTLLANGSPLADYGVRPATDPLGHNSSLPHSRAVKREKEEEEEEMEEEEQFAVEVKQEEELDAPLDFSIKRRDGEGASARPPHRQAFSSPSPTRLSPDSYYHQQQVSGREGRGHEHEVDKSPSPGEVKSAGGGGGSNLGARVSPAAVNSSLAALGLVPDGSGVSPAALTALLGQNGARAGPLSSVPSLLEEARKLQTASGGKVQRPFKAYPKEVLRMPLGYLGLPGVSPFPGMDPSYAQGLGVRPEELMTIYKQQTELLKEREKQSKNGGKRSSRSPPSSAVSPSPSALSANGRSSVTHTSPPPSSAPASPPQPFQPSLSSTHTDSPSPGGSAGSQASSTSQSYEHLLAVSQDAASSPPTLPASTAPPLVSSTSCVTAAEGSRKRPRNLPDTEKDEAYWERRRKNNDAAKRSRDARRAKEDEIALRAALLEQENLRLRVEVATLKTETARLRCLLYKT